MRKLVIAVLLVLLLPVCSFAGTKLFKDYEYGMSKEEVRNKSKAVPCQDSRVRGNLCIAQPVPFAGKEWEMAFMLDKDRLVSVVLVKPFDEITYNNVMKTTLVKNGFTPLYARADSYEVDIIAVAKKQGKEALKMALAKAYPGKAQTILYSFFDGEHIKSSVSAYQPDTLKDFLEHAEIGTRSVDVVVNNGMLLLKFLAPLDALADMKKDSSSAEEAF